MADLPHRRVAYSVHLSFLVPGIMSLGAITMGDVKIIWRLVFISAAVFGLAAMLFLITSGMPALGGRLSAARSLANGAALRAHRAHRGSAQPDAAICPGAETLTGKGLLLTLLVFLGASLAWSLLMAPKRNA